MGPCRWWPTSAPACWPRTRRCRTSRTPRPCSGTGPRWSPPAATNCSAAPRPALLLGQEGLVPRLARHPLARALRVDKLTLAALEATLAGPPVPVVQALAVTAASLSQRSERIVATLTRHSVAAAVVDADAAA